MSAGNKRAVQGDFAALGPGQLSPWVPYPSSSGRHSCFRKAGADRGFTPDLVGLADAKAENEAASRWADCHLAYGDWMTSTQTCGGAQEGALLDLALGPSRVC